MNLGISDILSFILTIAIFFLGWQLRSFSIAIENLKEDLQNMNRVLVNHVTDYEVHKIKE